MDSGAVKERRVVIVDDSRTMQALVETAFGRRRDFRVVGIADNAHSALDLVERLRPDVITIDMCMPYIDGATMLQMLAKSRGLCKVMVSDLAVKNITMKNKLEELGADACLSKRELVDDPAAFFDKIGAAAERVAGSWKYPTDPLRPPEKTFAITPPPATGTVVDFGFPLPADELARLAQLRRLHLANAVRERQFDLVTQYVAEATAFPVCLMTFIDRTTQWVKSGYGLDLKSTPRSEAFCAYTIAQDDTLIVTNAHTDRRFANNPLVAGDMRLRTYVGHPIIVADGTHLGAICVIDTKPRAIQKSALTTLSAMTKIVAEMIGNRVPLAA